MSELKDRVVLVTGAGRGLGAEYARLLAAQGATVVVNDLDSTVDSGTSPAELLVAEIEAAGGSALVDGSDITDWDAVGALVEKVFAHYGRLDALVNNAGILRDRMLVNMSVEDWDDVIRVHLRGHFCVTRLVASRWREEVKAGKIGDRVIVNTTSTSGLLGSVGQTNYGAAKSGVASFTQIVDMELHDRYGVRCYGVAPGARTRLTLATPGAQDVVVAPDNPDTFDYWDPANVAPLVAWLVTPKCPAPSGSVFHVQGDSISLFETWQIGATATNSSAKWTAEALDAAVPALFDKVGDRWRAPTGASVVP